MLSSLPRPAVLAAATGGALWTVKALVITVRDGSFAPLEGVAYFAGMAAIVTAAVLLAVHLTRGLGGAVRVAAAAAGTVGLVAATVAVEQLGHAAIAGLHAGGNVGLEEEGGILLAGLVWLAVAATGAALAREPERAPSTA